MLWNMYSVWLTKIIETHNHISHVLLYNVSWNHHQNEQVVKLINWKIFNFCKGPQTDLSIHTIEIKSLELAVGDTWKFWVDTIPSTFNKVSINFDTDTEQASEWSK